MPFGVTPTGFSMPTEAQLLALIEADQRADLSAALDQSESSVLGKNNRIYARRIFEAWQALKAIHDGTDVDKSVADQLTSLLKITGATRRSADHSLTLATVTLERGTTLEAGAHFAHVTGKPAQRWSPVESFVAPRDGDFTIMFRAEHTGPIDAPIGSIAVIATPVVGWSAVTNGEVTIGHDVGDDEDARERRKDSLQLAGSSTSEALRADMLALPTATTAQVFENWTDATDARGLPPKSFLVILDATGASDDEVAQAIWESKPAGIEPVGESSGTGQDAAGVPRVMRFTRVTQVSVWVTLTIERRDGYVGDELFKATLATRLDAAMKAGAELARWDIWTSTHGLGIKGKALAFGRAPEPTSETEIQFEPLELPRFDAGRITLVIA